MSRKSVLVRVAPWAALALGMAAAPAARADCKAVLDAMLKAANQQRVASFVVDDDKAAPVLGEDFAQIRIGKVVWTTQDGKNFERTEVAFPDLRMYQTFADLDRAGKMGCETLGAGSYRGAAVMRYRHNNPMMAHPLSPQLLKRYGVTEEQVRKFVVYVDMTSGLSVYGESFTPVGIKVGTATIYGDAVKEPATTAGKGKK